MKMKALYNPARDISPVDQFGFVDLESAYKNGVVPATIENEDIKYNNQTEPEHIGNVPRDKFDAYEYTRAVRAEVSKSDSGKKESE